MTAWGIMDALLVAGVLGAVGMLVAVLARDRLTTAANPKPWRLATVAVLLLAGIAWALQWVPLLGALALATPPVLLISFNARWPRGFLVVAGVSAALVALLALMSRGYLGPALRNPWVVGVTPLLFGAAFPVVLAVLRRRRSADMEQP